jgi:hypothetical protein
VILWESAIVLVANDCELRCVLATPEVNDMTDTVAAQFGNASPAKSDFAFSNNDGATMVKGSESRFAVSSRFVLQKYKIRTRHDYEFDNFKTYN